MASIFTDNVPRGRPTAKAVTSFHTDFVDVLFAAYDFGPCIHNVDVVYLNELKTM